MVELSISVEVVYEDSDQTVALVAVNGVNRWSVNHGSTTRYRVIGGVGCMEVDAEPISLYPGVEVEIKKGVQYRDIGRNLLLEAISFPPFNQEKVRYLD